MLFALTDSQLCHCI